jgi:hypothetical protein
MCVYIPSANMFTFPLQVKNKPHDGVAKRVFFLNLAWSQTLPPGYFEASPCKRNPLGDTTFSQIKIVELPLKRRKNGMLS